jgi:hypothetical protein
MYVVREVMQCKPGKVREMVNKFKSLSGVMQAMGVTPFRLLTDVSGEPFWTVVAEMEVERIDDFVAMEGKVMANEDARRAMAGYHDLVERGRREIYKKES